MIRYSLACAEGHSFEAWFRSGADSDGDIATGRVACPACGSTAVRKALMAPAKVGQAVAPPSPPPAAVPPSASEPIQVATPDPESARMMEAIREITRHVRANSDNVGKRFAEEARKIHYREVEPRSIYGEATPEDARGLMEEGIAFHPLPTLPEDRN